ncbi:MULTISPECIES: Sua5/YciO/YrdC/YwlC family protein [Moraxella]|uniref:Putative YciO protein, TsaC/YrdC like n=1 Tax=Moraxella catarrhalis TaxID=480 RepID=A0A7Z1A3S8_MORCA|nr:Sua5/YciO/YrdC/YwlC family protein [Moraxella catarrhalis]OAV00303.1 putative YciO protein, TsaC/YrdC like [Moraxella catarrhalis]STY82560.1 Putative translation factor (SUA5) [Moraxella catarrhalis]
MEKFYIHPDNPQMRLLTQAADLIKSDQLVVYPDPTGYRLALRLDAKQSLTQALRLSQNEPEFCLICRNISEISTFATISDFAHRILKSTDDKTTHFLLSPTKALSKKFTHPNDKTICINIAHTPITLGLIEILDAPFISMPIYMNGEKLEYDSIYELEMTMENLVDGFIHAGEIPLKTSPLISLLND